MKITVKFFAILRDKAGVSTLEMDVPIGTNAGAATKAIEIKLPVLAGVIGRAAFAVNQEYASAEIVLNDGDELALIPPVSGGVN